MSLVGPSGCGKSTLLQILAGFAPGRRGDPGRRHAVGTPLPSARRRLPASHSVPVAPWGQRGFRPADARVPGRDRTAIGRSTWRSSASRTSPIRPYELSGGMQQRTQIAVRRERPGVVLMDEPFGALDAITRERLQDELLRIWRGSGDGAVHHPLGRGGGTLGTRVLVMSRRPAVSFTTRWSASQRPPPPTSVTPRNSPRPVAGSPTPSPLSDPTVSPDRARARRRTSPPFAWPHRHRRASTCDAWGSAGPSSNGSVVESPLRSTSAGAAGCTAKFHRYGDRRRGPRRTIRSWSQPSEGVVR